MDNKTAIAVAKEFLDSLGYPVFSPNKDNAARVLTDFLQSMIEKGNVVETSNWISVNDRLPQSQQIVLILLNDTTISDTCQQVVKYGVKKFIGVNDPAERMIVTHWMPLPTAPGESTILSTVKEVTEKEIVDKAFELVEQWSNSGVMLKNTLQLSFCEMAKWALQFKSSPASTEQPDQQAGEVKTLRYCKEKVAELNVYISWIHLSTVLKNDQIQYEKLCDQANKMYYGQFKGTPEKIITDQEIESAGYADCGDKSNHRFTSADEIEPWIEGAKWYREQLK